MPSSPWSPEAYGRAGRLPSASKQELRGRRVRMNRAGPLLAPAELSALNPSQSLAGLRPHRLRRVRRDLREAFPGPRPLDALGRLDGQARQDGHLLLQLLEAAARLDGPRAGEGAGHLAPRTVRGLADLATVPLPALRARVDEPLAPDEDQVEPQGENDARSEDDLPSHPFRVLGGRRTPGRTNPRRTARTPRPGGTRPGCPPRPRPRRPGGRRTAAPRRARAASHPPWEKTARSRSWDDRARGARRIGRFASLPISAPPPAVRLPESSKGLYVPRVSTRP